MSLMRVIRLRPGAGAVDDQPIFEGTVRRQTAVAEESATFRVTEVSFVNGARTRPQVHASDQILLVSSGHGFIATSSESQNIDAGDIALISAGEKHWHGARPGEDMTHWSFLGPGETTIVP